MVPNRLIDSQINNVFKKYILGDLCNFTQGVQIASKDTIKELKEGYVRYIYIRDLFTDKFPVYVKDEHPHKLLSSGDIVMVNTGNTSGSVYKAKEGVLCNNAFKITIKSEKIDKEFLWVYLNSNARERMLKRLSNPAGQPHVGHKNVARLEVLLPPLLEQQKIAKILSTWDKAISTTERLIENSTQQKKALMQQLLTGKNRLLDDEGKRFEGEWELKKVSDYFDVSSSKRVLQEDWKDEGVPFYRTRELVSLAKNEPFRSSIYIAEDYYEELITKYGMPDEGDFLVSGVGTLGIIYQVRENDKFYFKDGNVLWFKKEKEVSSDFFKYCFLSDYIQNQINIQASVTTVGTYTITNAKKTRFHCPPLAEQQKIATVLTNADKEIELLEQQLADLQQEKKALMQVLLTGKKRVVVDGEV